MGQNKGLPGSEAPEPGWARSPAGRRWRGCDIMPLGRCQFSCHHSPPDSAEWGVGGELASEHRYVWDHPLPTSGKAKTSMPSSEAQVGVSSLILLFCSCPGF